MAQSKFWCFTINNPTDDDTQQLAGIECNYIIYGEEVGEEGTPHYQGYIEFRSNKRLNAMKKLMPRAHLEVRKGSQEQSIKYCKKDGLFHERGELTVPRQGKRTDLEKVREVVQTTGSMRAVVDSATSYQSIKFAEVMLKYVEPTRNSLPNVRWYYGDTGSGKTKAAIEEAGSDYWISGRNLKWWEGYDGHVNVILDDFRKDFCTFHELLRILDRYPYRVETKGGSRQLLATNIWVTTQFSPETIYDTREDVGQLLRRITTVRQFISLTPIDEEFFT